MQANNEEMRQCIAKHRPVHVLVNFVKMLTDMALWA